MRQRLKTQMKQKALSTSRATAPVHGETPTLQPLQPEDVYEDLEETTVLSLLLDVE
jgi:hypothetical protein